MTVSANNSRKQGAFTFRPRARLMHTVGDDLISDESVAILELVKNAYDADATHVLIEFTPPLEKGQGAVIIIDNGHGMSLDIVLGDWIQPATDTKRRKKHSPAGRRVLGEKGIGRFAAARLADELELVTRAAGSSEEIRALVDWTEFDRRQFLDEVTFLWEQGPPTEIHPGGVIERVWPEDTPDSYKNQGTILRLTKLYTSWNTESINRLRTALSRLVSPFAEGIDFTIRLALPPEYRHLAGDIGAPASLGHPDYVVRGHMTADGSYQLTYEHGGQSSPVLGRHALRPNNRTAVCGPFDIELRVWDRERKSLGRLAEAIGSTTQTIQQDLDEAAGISIYRDGFRVLPYGEPQNDWLRLDMRRVQSPVMRLSNNQVVGFILISADKNDELQDQTNREGIQQGQALDDLRALTRAVIAELEKRRYVDRHKEAPEEPPGKPLVPGTRDMFEGLGLQSLRDLVRQRYPNDRDLQMAMEQQDHVIAARIGLVKETLARYSRLATLGQVVDIVLHDGRTYLAQIGNEADLGRRNAKAIEGQLPTITRLTERFRLIGEYADTLGQLFRRIEPFGGRARGRLERVPIEQVIEDAVRIFATDIKQLGVDVILPQSRTEYRMVRGEVQQIFVNLVQNSLYWLQQESQGPRRIACEVRQADPNTIEILFCDSGPGVEEEVRERIFDPYFSGKTDGIGLGLTIAGETAAEYDGHLELVQDGLLPGACFLITLRQRSS